MIFTPATRWTDVRDPGGADFSPHAGVSLRPGLARCRPLGRCGLKSALPEPQTVFVRVLKVVGGDTLSRRGLGL